MGPQSGTGRARAVEWEQLRRLLGLVERGGLSELTDQELWELPGLYRRTLSDLSLLRSSGGAPQLTQELSQLCGKAHAVIYRGVVRRRGPGLLFLILHELPRTARRCAGLILGAAALMTLFSLIAYFTCVRSPAIAEDVLGAFRPNMLREWETALQTASKQQDLRLAAQIEPGERSFAAVAITYNNIQVGVNAFVLGIAGGVPSLIMLAFNGYLLGAVAFLYFQTPPGFDVNLPLYFIAGIAPHGSIELPAICLAAAAGMLLGFSWLFPGQRPRGEALRLAAREAGRLLAICALTLIVAGLIEGFLTPLNPPAAVSLELWQWAKIAFGALVFALWLAWLLTGGRGAEGAIHGDRQPSRLSYVQDRT